MASKKVGKGGYMVLRPDSGDPTEAVLMALVAAEKVRGCGCCVVVGTACDSVGAVMAGFLGGGAQGVACGLACGLPWGGPDGLPRVQ